MFKDLFFRLINQVSEILVILENKNCSKIRLLS